MRRTAFLLALATAACTSDSTDPGPIPADFVLTLQQVASGLDNPVYLTSPPGDSRLFIVEQPGRIRIVENGQLVATPFLDISSRVGSGGERGMLSVAFHPQYKSNGFFYVYFTATNGDIRIERFTVSSNVNQASAASSKLILMVPHPRTNHNGGLAAFGPDGMLYLGLGDGGGGGDPDLNGQNQTTLLGKLLRIDVNSGDPYGVPPDNPFAGKTNARQEIWAVGLRNPWRYAFDRMTGKLYVADVGQSATEEVNVVTSTSAGLNYGWNVLEGSACYNAASCNKSGFEIPVLEYAHVGAQCSITGGFVYRGNAIQELSGVYFYADYCAGWVRSFKYDNGTASDQREWDIGNVGNITSFGEDAAGELYITSSNGRVYKFLKG